MSHGIRGAGRRHETRATERLVPNGGWGRTESLAPGAAGLALFALVVCGRRKERGAGRRDARVRSRGPWRAVLVAWMALSLVAPARMASAATDEQRATARVLATEGFRAFQQGRWADVVDRFQRAESLIHAPPHLLYLARGYAHLGKLVEAHETYEKLARETLPPSAPRVSVRAQVDGAKELSELDPRVPSLTVVVTPASSNATVAIDGVALAPAMIGVEVPIDPGAHAIVAKASGFVEAHKTVTIAEASRSSVRLELAPASPEPVATGGAGGGDKAASVASAETPPAADRRSNLPSYGLRIGGYVASAVAVAAAGAGIAFVLESHRDRVDGDDLCPAGLCMVAQAPRLDTLNRNATLFGQLGVAAFVTAGAAAATGVTLFLLSSGKGNAEPAALWIGPGSAGVRGAF